MSDSKTTPLVGAIYFATELAPVETGSAALCVRTERLGGDAESHVVFAFVAGRGIHTRRTPLSALDTEWATDGAGARRADPDAAAERFALAETMKRAVELAPEHRAELIRTFRDAKAAA